MKIVNMDRKKSLYFLKDLKNFNENFKKSGLYYYSY